MTVIGSLPGFSPPRFPGPQKDLSRPIKDKVTKFDSSLEKYLFA